MVIEVSYKQQGRKIGKDIDREKKDRGNGELKMGK